VNPGSIVRRVRYRRVSALALRNAEPDRMGDEKQEGKIAELEADRPRVLVATDCFSERVNLQEKFTAAFH
jgi:hypothetical protein